MTDLYLYLPGILLAYAAFLLGIASPGPNILAVIGTSMQVGRASGVALALGVAMGSLTWAVLTVVGLSTVLTQYAAALIIIKIFGGLYLLWLAYKSFKSAAARHAMEGTQLAGGKRSNLGYAKRGYIIQMTNPKAVLAWVAIISLGLQHGAPLWVGGVIVAGTTLMSVAIHTLYALAFSTEAMVRLYGRAQRSIQATLGAFFAIAGIKLLTNTN